MKPQINSDFSQIRAIEVDRVKGRIASRPGMAIYAVNRYYLWNSNPWFIPACPPCAGVHPWLRNEETNL